MQAACVLWNVAAGAEKAQAVADGLAGDPAAPVSAAVGTAVTLWLLDSAAAAQDVTPA